MSGSPPARRGWPASGSHGLFQRVDEPLHQVLSQARVLGAVGLDEVLVDAPGGLDRSVALIGEQGLETLGLGIGEQAGPGQQGAPGPVEPVTRPAPPPRDRPLDPAAALIELAGSQGYDMKGIHDLPGLWDLLVGGAVETAEGACSMVCVSPCGRTDTDDCY